MSTIIIIISIELKNEGSMSDERFQEIEESIYNNNYIIYTIPYSGKIWQLGDQYTKTPNNNTCQTSPLRMVDWSL